MWKRFWNGAWIALGWALLGWLIGYGQGAADNPIFCRAKAWGEGEIKAVIQTINTTGEKEIRP